MTDKRKAFAPITDDIDSRIEAMARAKGVPSLTAPEAVLRTPPGAFAREGDSGAGGQPDVPATTEDGTAQATSPPRTKVTPVKSFVPDYAFMEIKLRAARERVSINHIVLKALHAAGYHIKPEDMIEDGRRLRGKRGGTHSIDALAELLRSQGLVIEQHRKTN